MKIPFVGGSYKDRSVDYNAQTCMNLYPIIDTQQQQSKEVLALYPTPGMKAFGPSGIAAEVRGLCVMQSFLYAVVGNFLYQFNTNGTATQLSSALKDGSNPVFMAQNGTQLMIVEPDIAGHIYTVEDGLVEISAEGFPVPSSNTYQDGYFIVTTSNSGQFQISGSYDGTVWAALDFATAEAMPDNARRIFAHLRHMWIFGDDTTEIWYNSGAADFPYERISGVIIPVGIDAPNSVAEIDESLYWLDNTKRVRRTEGYGSVPISTQAIEYWIGQYSRTDNAIGYGYKQEGHNFYVLTFPSANNTWVYDATTDLWHQRGMYLNATGTEGRHRSNCYAYYDGKHIVGDMHNGNLYELNLDYYKDDDGHIRRRRAAPAVHQDRRRIFHDKFEVDFESGVGLSVADGDLTTGTDPQAMLRWSDDGGHTWSNEYWTSIGEIGEYNARAMWRRLGQSRNRVYEMVVSDPVKTIIVSAHLQSRMGLH